MASDSDTMKDVIDVMQMQREKSLQVPAIDYRQSESNFIAVRFVFECGKLNCIFFSCELQIWLILKVLNVNIWRHYKCMVIAHTKKSISPIVV